MKIAGHYNRLYRVGKNSQYTADNVSLGMGGRLCLTRVFAAINNGKLGYQNPDYTAYEDMINYHAHRLEPVLIPTFEENGFGIPGNQIADVIKEHHPRINTAIGFFREALKRKVMVVPGYFFDIDPKKERIGNSPLIKSHRYKMGFTNNLL